MTTAVDHAACAAHFFVLEPPNGPRTIGRCKTCGFTRWFSNSMPEMERTNNSDIFAAPRRGAGRGSDYALDATSDHELEAAIDSMRGSRRR